MGVPATAQLNPWRTTSGRPALRALALAGALLLAWPGVSGAEGPATPAAKPAARPAAAPIIPVVLPFPGLAPAPAPAAGAKPKPVRHRRRPAPRHVAQAAPPPPPPPPPVEHRGGDNVQVNLADLPASARQALLELHDRLAAGACRGISLSAFQLGLTPIIATQYNDDGRPDFFFHDPCSRGGVRAEGSTLLLLSDPLGYHLSPTFAAALGEVDGRPVLLAHTPCDPTSLGPGRDCLLARFWDPARRRWSEIQEVRPDVATGGGPVPTPLAAPAAPTAPAPTPVVAESLPAAK